MSEQSWTKAPPKESGWYWCRHRPDAEPEARWFSPGDWISPEFGPRIPTPAAIEAAREALEKAKEHLGEMCCESCPEIPKIESALALLDGKETL